MKRVYNLVFNLSVLVAAVLASCQAGPAKQSNSQAADTTVATARDSAGFIKEQALRAYIPAAATVRPNAANGAPFDTLAYDKIIGYDFDGRRGMHQAVMDAKGRFVPVVLAQQALTQQQADGILSALSKPSSYGEGTSACFLPHFALVFYRQNKKVNQVNVCLDCNYLVSEVDIPATTQKKLNPGTKNEIPLMGFSTTGRSAIIALCKELGFKYGRVKDKN